MAFPRTLTRSLVTAGALAGIGAAYVVGSHQAGGGGADGPDPWRAGTSDASPAAYTGSDLSLATSCAELLDWYVGRGVDRVGPYGWDAVYDYPVFALEDGAVGPTAVGGDQARDLMASGAADSAQAPGAALPGAVRATNEETGTNVQEAGVDEPDTVKTDGRTLFRVEGDDLVTYDVTGDEVARLGSVDLPVGDPQGMELLLAGETVVVVAERGGDQARLRMDGTSTGTDVVTVDVADPAAPRITRTATYDTGLVTARLHDGVVRLVLQAGLPELDFVTPDDRTTEWEATRANQERVRESTIEDWLPTVSYDAGADQQLLDCEAVAVPEGDRALGTLAVVGFDAPALDAPSVSGLAVDSDLVYASADQLYVATSPYDGWATRCLDCLDPLPATRPGVGDDLLPRWFPGSSRSRAPDDAEQGSSQLYAFDLDGLDTDFAAEGQVDGAIRDRWSLDEHDGTLRVAVGPTVRTGDFNSIVTFRQEGNDLVEAGRLDQLGVGEEIQSVRWFDTLAIVVTFRQVDPLYAVDLTSTQPELMGLLKIPGFSAYLHPLGQHRLLGLGEGPGEGGQWGAQAGLFDVTDLTDPTRLDVLGYGPGSQALATQDPRQLTWLPDDRTVLSVVADWGSPRGSGYVSVLTLGGGSLDNRMVEIEQGADLTQVRLVPIPDGRVVLVTGTGAEFFAL